MRAFVVVESVFGNTRRIAEEVAHGLAEGLGVAGQVRLADVSNSARPVDRVDLLVVGGPTHAFAMTRTATRRSAAEQAGSGAQPTEAGLREWLAAMTKAHGRRHSTPGWTARGCPVPQQPEQRGNCPASATTWSPAPRRSA